MLNHFLEVIVKFLDRSVELALVIFSIVLVFIIIDKWRER